jgi:hypothetical protein
VISITSQTMMKTKDSTIPTYSFINTETKDEFEEFFKNWSSKDEFLEANPNIKQTLRVGPTLSYNDAKKPDESFRDILREIKKANPKGDVNTF